MEIKDLTGLSEPLKKLIEVVSQGVGALSKPYLIRKTADAKAYEIKVIAESIKDNQESLKQIGYNEEKLSLISLDGETIKNELTLEERTQNRINYKEQKKQKNIESITQKAAINLESEETVSSEPVDEDWTTRFFNYAEDISNEEMQELWARVLAGEIKQPNSYSLRTLELIRNLSKDEASAFTKVAKFAIKVNKDALIYKGDNNEILDKFNIRFDDIALLQEIDLLHSGEFVSYSLKKTPNINKIGFQFGDTIVVTEKQANSPEQSFSVMLFTKIGKELLHLVKSEPEFEYVQLFAKKLRTETTSVKYGKILERNKKFIKHTQPLIEVPNI